MGSGVRVGVGARLRLRAGVGLGLGLGLDTRSPLSGAQKAAVMSREVAASAVTKRKARRSEMYLYVGGW